MSLAFPWLLLCLPLPLLVRWLVPAVVRSRPALKVPFMKRVERSTRGNSEGAHRPSGSWWVPVLV